MQPSRIWMQDMETSPVVCYGSSTGFILGQSYVSCYFTSNESITEFREKLDRLEDIGRSSGVRRIQIQGVDVCFNAVTQNDLEDSAIAGK